MNYFSIAYSSIHTKTLTSTSNESSNLSLYVCVRVSVNIRWWFFCIKSLLQISYRIARREEIIFDTYVNIIQKKCLSSFLINYRIIPKNYISSKKNKNNRCCKFYFCFLINQESNEKECLKSYVYAHYYYYHHVKMVNKYYTVLRILFVDIYYLLC